MAKLKRGRPRGWRKSDAKNVMIMIRVDEKMLGHLAKIARPFESRSAVIRRLIDDASRGATSWKKWDRSMELNEAFEVLRQAIGEDSGGNLTPLQGIELMGILREEGAPDSCEDCVVLVMGEEDESGASVPERLKQKHPKLHEWLDVLLT